MEKIVYIIPVKSKACRRKSKEAHNHLKSGNGDYFAAVTRSKVMSELFPNRTTSSSLLKKLMSSDYPFAAKCVWLTIVTICFGLTLTQIGQTIGFYLSEPVSVSVKVVRNDSLRLPRITVCGKARFGEKKIKTMQQQLADRRGLSFADDVTFDDLIDEYGVDVVWTNTSYNVPQILQKCRIFHGGSCVEFGYWIPTFTIFGLCYSYKLDARMTQAGPYQALYITLNPDDEVDEDKKGWKILLHHPDVKPDLLIKTEGFTLDQNARVDAVLDYQQSIATASHPCNRNSSYSVSECEASCIYQMVSSKFTCRLPYMTSINAPLCQNSSEYNGIMEFQDSILDDGTISVSQMCGCPRPCHENIYKVKLDLRSWIYYNQTTIKVYFDELTYERVEEHSAYGVVQLLSDIGGNLGLFLGVCVVSIFEVGETIICSAARLFRLMIYRNQKI